MIYCQETSRPFRTTDSWAGLGIFGEIIVSKVAHPDDEERAASLG